MENNKIIEITDVSCVITQEKQEYTAVEIGIPGIKLIGHYINNKAHESLMLHKHTNCIELSYCVTGNQIYKTLNEEYLFSGNSIFIAYPGEPHGAATYSEGKIEVYWIQFENDFSDNFLSLQNPFSKALHSTLFTQKKHLFKCKNDLKHYFENAILNLPNENFLKKFSGLISIFAFLNEIIEFNEINHSSSSPQIKKAISYINENINNRVSLEDVANHVELSLSHFKKTFKQEIGDTPNSYINNLKIQKAKKMLDTKKFSITEVAYNLDFSSSAYFSFVFKNHTNISPREYSRNIKTI